MTTAPLGVHGAINVKTAERITGNTVTGSHGLRDERVSIDENHGRAPYRDSGPLLLYRLLHPTYAAGQASIRGRTLPVGFVLFNGPSGPKTVKSGEDWRLTYDGGFTKSMIGLPTALGSAESYRPVSLSSSDPVLDPDNLEDLGNRAYGLLRPKISKANLTQSLAELGGMPRMLKTTSKGFHELWNTIAGNYAGGRLYTLKRQRRGNPWTMSPKGAGDQFLNVQFGWAPFLQDLADVTYVTQNLASLAAEAARNNGRWQSRRFHEDVVESVDVLSSTTGVTSNLCHPTLNNQWMIQPNTGSETVTLRQVTRVWYEASVKVYRPEFDPALTRGHPALKAAEQAAALYGLRVNPTTVYRTLPWTWLADYLGSFSSGLQRAEDMLSGEAVFRRFHLMRMTFKQYEYRVKFTTFDGKAHDITWVKRASVKRRANGQNAFGFSASPGGLTGMQHAILAALAGSKLSKR